MIQFRETIEQWGTAAFNHLLKKDISALNGSQLPLQQGLSLSSVALDDQLDVILLKVSEVNGEVHVKSGVFYTGIIAGCSCSDDPSPTDRQNEYCEMLFKIDKQTGAASVALL